LAGSEWKPGNKRPGDGAPQRRTIIR
jgi:hypothetical protein